MLLFPIFRLRTLVLASTFAIAAPSAHAIELIVHPSTVVKALKSQIFKDKGRYYLQRPDRCSDPYLENPTVSFKQGRIHVGARFAGRIGALIGGVCKSVSEAGTIVLSARPVAHLHEVALVDVRLEAADKPIVAAAVQNLIGSKSLAALHIDLSDAIRPLTAPDKTAPYTIVVRELELSNLVVQNDELRVTVGGVIDMR